MISCRSIHIQAYVGAGIRYTPCKSTKVTEACNVTIVRTSAAVQDANEGCVGGFLTYQVRKLRWNMCFPKWSTTHLDTIEVPQTRIEGAWKHIREVAWKHVSKERGNTSEK
jgi:hypothetical protein